MSFTGECRRYKDRCKTTDPPDKWCVTDEPIVATDVSMVGVSSAINRNTKDDEYLIKWIRLSMTHNGGNGGRNIQ